MPAEMVILLSVLLGGGIGYLFGYSRGFQIAREGTK